jgi:hypothetical protein
VLYGLRGPAQKCDHICFTVVAHFWIDLAIMGEARGVRAALKLHQRQLADPWIVLTQVEPCLLTSWTNVPRARFASLAEVANSTTGRDAVRTRQAHD